MQNNYQPNTDHSEEKLWNEHLLNPATREWNTAVVLCSYKWLRFWEMKEIAKIIANKVDKKFGTVKKGKTYNISQRIEKAQMLEYAADKRGWHVNMFLNRPDYIDEAEFKDFINSAWLNILLNSWQANHIGTDNKLCWCEEAVNNFYMYAFKKRTETVAQRNEVETANDLIITSTFTLHETTINS